MRTERVLADVLRAHLSGQPKPVPEWAGIYWRWFSDLCRTRTAGFRANPISYAEIEAYARLYRWPMEPRHVSIILALDAVWLEHARQALPQAAGKPDPATSPTISPEAFDAVFS